jgi:predicted tellurium resistance membrane protein TerC
MAAWIVALKEPFIVIMNHGISVRDVILFVGGAYLLYEAIGEIHDKLEFTPDDQEEQNGAKLTFRAAIIQIIMLDAVFSTDSIITAVGMTNDLWIMVTAVIISVSILMFASKPLSAFIHKHPTTVMLALGFLLMIGTSLIAESFHFEIPKGFIYAAMLFAILIESLNIIAKKNKMKHIHKRINNLRGLRK